jgi:hypothetical protein
VRVVNRRREFHPESGNHDMPICKESVNLVSCLICCFVLQVSLAK